MTLNTQEALKSGLTDAITNFVTKNLDDEKGQKLMQVIELNDQLGNPVGDACSVIVNKLIARANAKELLEIIGLLIRAKELVEAIVERKKDDA